MLGLNKGNVAKGGLANFKVDAWFDQTLANEKQSLCPEVLAEFRVNPFFLAQKF